MELSEACHVLGLSGSPEWTEVRSAYRHRISLAHPDRPGGDTAGAARLNDAYATLARHRRDGTSPREPAPTRQSAGVPPETLQGEAIHITAPLDEAFSLLHAACARVGHVSYADPSCGVLEARVQVEGEGACSLLITLEASGAGTEALCTLESIHRVASPPVSALVRALVEAL